MASKVKKRIKMKQKLMDLYNTMSMIETNDIIEYSYDSEDTKRT